MAGLKDKTINKLEDFFNKNVLKRIYKFSDKQISLLPSHKWTIKNTYEVIKEIEGAKPKLMKAAAIGGAGILSSVLAVGTAATSALLFVGDLLLGGLVTATALTLSAVGCGVAAKRRVDNFRENYEDKIKVGVTARIIPHKGKEIGIEVGKGLAVKAKNKTVDVVRTKILKKPSNEATVEVKDNTPKAIVLGEDGKIVISPESLTVDKSKFYKEQQAKNSANTDKARSKGKAFGKAAGILGKAAKKAASTKIEEVKINRAKKKNQGKQP